MSAPRGGKAFVWVSWLCPLLAGEAQCHYAAYVKAHFRYQKRVDPTFNLAAWNADHSKLLAQRRRELEADGWQVTLENANAFRLTGSTAILAGKPDLIASRDHEWRVVDTKTGQQKNRDWWQGLLYCYALPKAFGIDATRLSGEICYPSHRIPIAPDELTADRADAISALVRQIACANVPPPIPSASECAWCDVAECAARIETSVIDVAVSEF